MLGVQYSFYKIEVTFTICKGLTQPYYARMLHPMCNIPMNLFK